MKRNKKIMKDLIKEEKVGEKDPKKAQRTST
jgi:hypothetical protein